MSGNQKGYHRVRVVARIRELTDELSGEERFCWKQENENTVVIKADRKVSLQYDAVYGEEAKQKDIYKGVAKPILLKALAGMNGALMAYGQTSSGKTHTIQGDEETPGILPRLLHGLFKRIKEREHHTTFKVTCSFLEIYLDKVYDLLCAPGSEESTKVLQIVTSGNGFWVKQAKEEIVKTQHQAKSLHERAKEARKTRDNGINQQSSRSHSIFVINILQENKAGERKASKLMIVDLAGSEKPQLVKQQAQIQEETKEINNSLTGLRTTVSKLAGNFIKKEDVRSIFRGDSLTKLLSLGLGGNSNGVIIITLSPLHRNVPESINTCTFGSQAMGIKSSPKVNPAEEQKAVRIELKEVKGQLDAKFHEILDLKEYAEMRARKYVELEEKWKLMEQRNQVVEEQLKKAKLLQKAAEERIKEAEEGRKEAEEGRKEAEERLMKAENRSLEEEERWKYNVQAEQQNADRRIMKVHSKLDQKRFELNKRRGLIRVPNLEDSFSKIRLVDESEEQEPQYQEMDFIFDDQEIDPNFVDFKQLLSQYERIDIAQGEMEELEAKRDLLDRTVRISMQDLEELKENELSAKERKKMMRKQREKNKQKNGVAASYWGRKKRGNRKRMTIRKRAEKAMREMKKSTH